MVTNLLIFLLLFMIIAAVAALQTKNLLSAVISVGAVGFGVSVAFLLLRAPDVAITQIAVEVLTLLLLIRATIWRGVRTVSGQREVFGSAVAVVLVLLILLLVLPVFSGLSFGVGPQMELASSHYLQQGLSETGSANIVTAVLLDYRAYDTLGEATVLFTAIIGALVLMRQQARKPLEE